MSQYLGDKLISGISQNTKYNAHHLLDFKWTDCIMNDVSWLRADTFSWQSGDVYTSAYNHLVADLQGTTAETETIGSYTVTFYRATDDHKICLADQESTVLNIYNESGIAWYYIVDTTNTQFKLPRTKFGFEGFRTNVGDKIDESLPNITGDAGGFVGGNVAGDNGSLYTVTKGTQNWGGNITSGIASVAIDASRSSSTYQDNAPVQERATQMYLYFYVGNYSQTAIEQTAGLNAELFNGKADINLNNVPSSKSILTESYVNGTSWYRVYSDGWCEQGGRYTVATSGSGTITFLKAFGSTNYSLFFEKSSSDSSSWNVMTYIPSNTSSSAIVKANLTGYTLSGDWIACGYIS